MTCHIKKEGNMDLSKDAIEKIESMANPVIYEGKDGNEYVIEKDGSIEQIREELDYPLTLMLTSLDALVKMVKTEALPLHSGSTLYIEVSKHDHAECFMQPDPKLRQKRLSLYKVSATDVPGWKEDESLPFEQALIAVRTRFQHSADSHYLLGLLSEVSCGAKLTIADNGVATTVVTRKGIDLCENAVIRPIVALKPYRTFQEVDQPESEFHIRISEKGIRFIEADGGMWKLAARNTVVEYLCTNLEDEVKSGQVVIML